MITEIDREFTKCGLLMMYYDHYEPVWKYTLCYKQDGKTITLGMYETKFFAQLNMKKFKRKFGSRQG